jgi:hypothetical protein
MAFGGKNDRKKTKKGSKSVDILQEKVILALIVHFNPELL